MYVMNKNELEILNEIIEDDEVKLVYGLGVLQTPNGDPLIDVATTEDTENEWGEKFHATIYVFKDGKVEKTFPKGEHSTLYWASRAQEEYKNEDNKIATKGGNQ